MQLRFTVSYCLIILWILALQGHLTPERLQVMATTVDTRQEGAEIGQSVSYSYASNEHVL